MKNLRLSVASILVLAVLFFPCLRVFASEGDVEFLCSADAYTDMLDPLSNYGGVHYLYLANDQYAIQMVWFKFNLSHVPDGAEVDYAAVKVFPTVLTVTHEVSAYYCSNNTWGEYTINYINQPLKTFDNSTVLDKTLVGISNEWYSWNVTRAVKSALDNASDTLTIVLKQTNWDLGLKQLGIIQREYSFVSNLYIHWTDVVPEYTTVTTILGVFVAATLVMIVVSVRKRPDFSAARDFDKI